MANSFNQKYYVLAFAMLCLSGVLATTYPRGNGMAQNDRHGRRAEANHVSMDECMSRVEVDEITYAMFVKRIESGEVDNGNDNEFFLVSEEMYEEAKEDLCSRLELIQALCKNQWPGNLRAGEFPFALGHVQFTLKDTIAGNKIFNFLWKKAKQVPNGEPTYRVWEFEDHFNPSAGAVVKVYDILKAIETEEVRIHQMDGLQDSIITLVTPRFVNVNKVAEKLLELEVIHEATVPTKMYTMSCGSPEEPVVDVEIFETDLSCIDLHVACTNETFGFRFTEYQLEDMEDTDEDDEIDEQQVFLAMVNTGCGKTPEEMKKSTSITGLAQCIPTDFDQLVQLVDVDEEDPTVVKFDCSPFNHKPKCRRKGKQGKGCTWAKKKCVHVCDRINNIKKTNKRRNNCGRTNDFCAWNNVDETCEFAMFDLQNSNA